MFVSLQYSDGNAGMYTSIFSTRRLLFAIQFQDLLTFICLYWKIYEM